MKYIKLFENFNTSDISEELDNWIEANSDYISSYYLEDKVKELLGLDDEITSSEKVERSTEGNEYGENWSTKIIIIKYNDKDLIKVCVTMDNRYDFGKNSILFRGLPKDKVVSLTVGVRFYFDRSLLG
jgi:hypothetical protein